MSEHEPDPVENFHSKTTIKNISKGSLYREEVYCCDPRRGELHPL